MTASRRPPTARCTRRCARRRSRSARLPCRPCSASRPRPGTAQTCWPAYIQGWKRWINPWLMKLHGGIAWVHGWYNPSPTREAILRCAQGLIGRWIPAVHVARRLWPAAHVQQCMHAFLPCTGVPLQCQSAFCVRSTGAFLPPCHTTYHTSPASHTPPQTCTHPPLAQPHIPHMRWGSSAPPPHTHTHHRPCSSNPPPPPHRLSPLSCASRGVQQLLHVQRQQRLEANLEYKVGTSMTGGGRCAVGAPCGRAGGRAGTGPGLGREGHTCPMECAVAVGWAASSHHCAVGKSKRTHSRTPQQQPRDKTGSHAAIGCTLLLQPVPPAHRHTGTCTRMPAHSNIPPPTLSSSPPPSRTPASVCTRSPHEPPPPGPAPAALHGAPAAGAGDCQRGRGVLRRAPLHAGAGNHPRRDCHGRCCCCC